MKKLIFPALIILIIFGFYTNNKNKKLNIAKKICGEYFKTQDEKCLRNPKQYDSILARQDAKKQLQEYISKVKPILKRIDNLTINNTDINPFEYSPVSYSDLDSITDRTKLKGKKIIISGDNTGTLFNSHCFAKTRYYVCVKQQAYDNEGDDIIENSKEISIININNFAEIKAILDDLYDLSFLHYKIIVYGIIDEFGILSHKIKADYIRVENVLLKPHYYESSLRTKLFKKYREEFQKYYSNTFTN